MDGLGAALSLPLIRDIQQLADLVDLGLPVLPRLKADEVVACHVGVVTSSYPA